MSQANSLQFKALCPQCGGELSFSTQASIFAVCPYCRSTLSRDRNTVEKIGEIGTLFEDYSRIQIGTYGNFKNKKFIVVGRYQMRYGFGYWNEWYLSFDDGTDGWLSDASGQYAIMQDVASKHIEKHFSPQSSKNTTPDFNSTKIGSTLVIEGETYIASDKRVCDVIAAEGELPLQPTFGKAYVIDYRTTDSLVTLDFQAKSLPLCYRGNITKLITLNAQNLRHRDTVTDTAGRAMGDLLPLECPNCSASISIAHGIANQAICPSCQSTIDFSGDQAAIIAKNNTKSNWIPALKLGEIATYKEQAYTIIGILLCEEAIDPEDTIDPEDEEEYGYEDNEEPSRWEEYQLFNPDQGFLWLVNQDSVWSLVEVCNHWPTLNQHVSKVKYQDKTFVSKYPNYRSMIVQAIGAFNWQPKKGDCTILWDFHYEDQETLCCERSEEELLWTHAKRLSALEINAMLGRTIITPPAAKNRSCMGLIILLLVLPIIIFIVYFIMMKELTRDRPSSAWGGSGSYSSGSFGHK